MRLTSSPIARTTFCVSSSQLLYPNLSCIDMTLSCLRLVSADTGELISFDPKMPVLLLLKVANPSDNFTKDLGKGTAAFTPTLSSPQPQAGAIAGRLTKALLGASVTSTQETTLNFNALLASLASSISRTRRSFSSSLLLSRHYTHQEMDVSNGAIPSFNFTGLFNFMGIPNFEALFNILVIFGLLYLFFTPPVSGLPRSSFPCSLITTVRLGMTPLRTNYSDPWTPASLMTPS
jgi:hypothetical protein